MIYGNKALIEVLRNELAFIERGGYRQPAHAPWRAQFMFEDSPTCLNVDLTKPRRPCSECPLISFVPEERRKRRAPCRFIQLNEAGETVDSLYRADTQTELEKVVANWLRTTIGKLQRETNEAAEETPTIHVKGKVVSVD